ncbi:hypothetical protein MNBD_CPR01-230 [hydrothermal vent metagenome]|uniref:DNA 3'-5' helicase n=1 Tax=hydrothermal vent metagenome TaxID=652676 RepID=A0A3B0VJP7_9ZZZZ
MENNSAFDEAYKTLTKEQKLAVDTVEGPVIVLAGPGTGKTHILTLRIANILRITQAKPDAILALTFTDSATRTMRRRLASIIGEETSRKVTIATFHGFADMVRAEYPDSFVDDTDRRLMSNVDETLLMREAIDSAEIDLLRPARSPYTYLFDLKTLHSTLSREGMSLDEYTAWGKKASQEMSADESLQYKKGPHAGELTKEGIKKISRFDKVDEAVRVLKRYNTLKDEHHLTSFSDMLTGVVDAVAKDEALRSSLQERYQYILADEHQDTNALQHKLLELFAYDNHPNLFVVGDEKQAIYRFQGAELGAFKRFTELFPRAVVVTLTSSFRSYQHVLDIAHNVAGDCDDESQRLDAVRESKEKETKNHVFCVEAQDPLDELSQVGALVEKSIKSGVLPHEIAIIARKNSTANEFAEALTARGIPILRAGDISITSRPIMLTLIALMQYVADPTLVGSLREALLAPWWGKSLANTLILLRTSYDNKLLSELARVYPDISDLLMQFIKYARTETPVSTFSFIFTESGARDYFLSHAECLDDIALVRALMMNFESATRFTEATTFSDAFASLTKAREHGLSPVNVSVTEREGFVTVITAHKAKGMEFKEVFVVECTESGWEKGGRAMIIPFPFENKQTLDDVRRLFYVALTRAKDNVYLSYARESAEGRDRLPTILMPAELTKVHVQNTDAIPILHKVIVVKEKIREFVDKYLDTEGLSPSSVNEYMESPPTFFARRVLRIHEPPAPPLIYGIAMHASLAAALAGATKEESLRVLAKSFEHSLLPRDATFESLRRDARTAFDATLPNLADLGTPVYIEKYFSMKYEVDGVLITLGGKVDVVFERNSERIVADFKTGSSVSAKNESYTRQLALYTAILSENKENVMHAELLGVSDKGIKRVPVAVGEEEKTKALKELEEVVRELRSGSFHRGTASDYDAILELLDT